MSSDNEDFLAQVAFMLEKLTTDRDDLKIRVSLLEHDIRSLSNGERTDADRFAFLSDNEKVTSILVNKWLVQIIYNGKWHQAYFAIPPSGIKPDHLYDNRNVAYRVVVDEIMDEVLQ